MLPDKRTAEMLLGLQQASLKRRLLGEVAPRYRLPVFVLPCPCLRHQELETALMHSRQRNVRGQTAGKRAWNSGVRRSVD